uniref:L antigen family member 3 n=1 Tax=Strigamia maritima TaxID=126957 RepID=T1JN24_STRMM
MSGSLNLFFLQTGRFLTSYALIVLWKLGLLSKRDYYRSIGFSMCVTDIRSLNVPFPDETGAEIALNTLKVDIELKRGGVTRILSRNKNNLLAEFSATETRSLRVSVNSFFEHLNLVIKTLEEFAK